MHGELDDGKDAGRFVMSPGTCTPILSEIRKTGILDCSVPDTL